MLRGVPDVGFSSYAAPTYNLVSEYFGFQEPRCEFGAEHLEGAWSVSSGNKSCRSCTQSRFTRCLTSRMEGPYILES